MGSWKRKLTILAKLSKFKKTTAYEIQSQLESEGVSVTLRTVQRDLEELEMSQQYAIIRDDSKPIGWSIAKSAGTLLPNVDLTTSITFALVDEHLSNILPPVLKERLTPYTQTSKQYLRFEKKLSESQWPKKICVESKGLSLQPVDVSSKIIDVIYTAVLRERCLKLRYKSLLEHVEKEYVFHPYGIVVRGERTYLVGVFDGYIDTRQLLLSRIFKADMLDKIADIDSTFSLKKFVAAGEMGVKRDLDKLKLKLWVTPVLATILDETPLSKDQVIEPKENDYMVSALVEDTDELRHWLLSMCNHATVMEPKAVREEITQTLRDSISWYED
ncbi:WYL domain-containing protein [Vibrio sp. 10N.286.49.C2]|uniref:helix-turn-helix transcriptional regulator n=1 Tax=unclassified Vibrio TaxID=2614977 RepID=UPI000C8443FC|nr:MULTISPECIES: WYL domain-containing protein [unclassified Vibrio]PMH40081.1 WYL domain-containing protein [Vibrio sp. 10N.286.49.C2]PMH52144.1 WYL domain-containing protein [Vibrio sp. 10N.286.49.B1]PMH78978.1 WYL domain-containing protein [Vibrio sp. 10N.286.48.B7]